MSLKKLILEKGKLAKESAGKLAIISTELKNNTLLKIADAIEKETAKILEANKKDLRSVQENNSVSKSFTDRLTLTPNRIKQIAEGVREIAKLDDPVGEIVNMQKRPNGLMVGKMRVPLGVIGIIYESRPNVTVDAACLCLKSGNAVILRGGSEAINTNLALYNIMVREAETNGLPQGCMQFIETTQREAVSEMLKLAKYIDVIIPRGGKDLIEYIIKNASIPVIAHGAGNCHVYVDSEADLKMAENIVYNAKVQRPGVCNAMETLLVHKEVANIFLPAVAKRLKEANVELRGCSRTGQILPDVKKATEEDWWTEYLDLILAIKIVDNIDEAIKHINYYGSSHSDAIVTNNCIKTFKFLREVDSAAVYVNASTRFTDGFEFGLGAEIGISTQKLHARGPMGLVELTTTKFVILGEGQIRI